MIGCRGALMISPCQTKDSKIICDNYSNALGTLKEKLYNGEYYTSTNSSVCVAYTRKIHRYQVFSSQDNSVPIIENPRSKENYDTIRILDIPTTSDDFDKYIESQMELAKLNNNLSDRMTDHNGLEESQDNSNNQNDFVTLIVELFVRSVLLLLDFSRHTRRI